VRRIAPPAVRLIAGLVVLALVAVGCTQRTRWLSPVKGPGATPGATANAIAWRPCPDLASSLLSKVPTSISYECGTVRVPQDWSSPGAGPTFDLALVRIRGHQSGRIGSLVFNPGGPGVSGVEQAVYFSTELPSEVLQRFDLIGFDPRGVGRSNPVKCFSDSDQDRSFAADPDPVSQADFDAIVALDQRMAAGCQAKYGDTLRLFSTEQTARDMDAIRVAIGDARLSYLGYSYGTLLGAVYAQLFPNRVRAMVLDGAIDPTAGSVASSQSQAQGFEHAFDEFATWCVQQRCRAGADPRATVTGLIAAARTKPVKFDDGRSATGGWILTAVAGALYSSTRWKLLGDAIGNLVNGDPEMIFLLADEYAGRDLAGHYTNEFDMFSTVECDDDPGTETVAQARSLQADWRARYPLFGAYAAVGLASCAVWPAKRDPFPTGRAVGAPPIVVVGTTNDPATPYEQAGKLADMLGVGQVLTWQGEGHTAYPQTDCLRRAVDGYLIQLAVPAKGLTCPAK
jgi:pimeloyl-ACP methyl ester carboxylesterase